MPTGHLNDLNQSEPRMRGGNEVIECTVDIVFNGCCQVVSIWVWKLRRQEVRVILQFKEGEAGR